MQGIDPRLVSRIHELVDKGVDSVAEMRRCLTDYVENTLFTRHTKPSPFSTRFYPTNQDIMNHVQIALRKKL